MNLLNSQIICAPRAIFNRVGHLIACAALLSGCAVSGLVKNTPIEEMPTGNSQVEMAFSKILSDPQQGVMLAFSGGGTRAAALAYAVLQELRDTQVGSGNQRRALLSDVGLISSVSGGSFTAAYFGLHGEQIFDDFEREFLRKNVEAPLVNNLFNPFYWLGALDRTEFAIRYYDKQLFKGATFADMQRDGAPLILINATDLSHGVRFSFMQEYFNLLCSDLSSFSVSRAVTASSAVPILFDPVVVKNFDNCRNRKPAWLRRAAKAARGNPELMLTVSGLESYLDPQKHAFAHFVDGGITDNLGLRAIFDISQLTGEAWTRLKAQDVEPAKRIVVISVDAATQPEHKIGESHMAPDVFTTIDAVTDIQLQRYNIATINEMQRSLDAWASRISTPTTSVEVFSIRVSFDQLSDQAQKSVINQIPTSFNLNDEQVDLIIDAGRELLRTNPEFQRLIEAINAEADQHTVK